MRILFVNRFLPHAQARDSGRLDTYHYLAELAKEHEVSLISFVADEDRFALPELEVICQQVIVIPYQESGLASRLQRVWRQLLFSKVYGRVYSRHYRRTLRELMKTAVFDAVIVHGMMAQYGTLLGDTTRILDEVDLFFMVAHHLYLNEKRPLLRLRALIDWLQTAVLESHYASNYNGVTVRSLKDKQIIRSFLPQQRVSVLPPWFEGLDELIDIPLQRPLGNKILFVGAMHIPANIEAVVYFANQVIPLIQKEIPDATFEIVGGNPVADVRHLGSLPGVSVVGEVPTLRPYYETAAVTVVPLFIGGGIIVKTLNGMASGRPTVITETGNSGTGAQHNQEVWITATAPDIFAQATLQFLTDQVLWERFAGNGRRFIQKQYSWSQIMTNLNRFLHDLPPSRPDISVNPPE